MAPAPSCYTAIAWMRPGRPSSTAPLPMPATWMIPMWAPCTTREPPSCPRFWPWPRERMRAAGNYSKRPSAATKPLCGSVWRCSPSSSGEDSWRPPPAAPSGRPWPWGNCFTSVPRTLPAPWEPPPPMPADLLNSTNQDRSSSASTGPRPLNQARYPRCSRGRASGGPGTSWRERRVSFGPLPTNPIRPRSPAVWGLSTG